MGTEWLDTVDADDISWFILLVKVRGNDGADPETKITSSAGNVLGLSQTQ